MKKRFISMLLVLAMMVGIVPVSAVNTDSKYYVADNMTEAEAFAAGFDVYMAWFNYHNAYADIVTNPIEAIYEDEESAFNQLFALIYPDGGSSDRAKSVLDEAERWLEDHYDGIDQFSEVESEVMMSLLLACVLYTGLSEDSSDNDVTEAENVIKDSTLLGWNVYNFQWMQDLVENSLSFRKNASPLEWLADMSEEFEIGDYAFGVISSIIIEGATSEIDKQNAIATAAKYDTIKSVAASDIDIMREFESYGHIGKYIKAYTEGYDALWSTGESTFEENLLKNISHSDLFVDMGVGALKSASSAVVAQYGASTSLGIGASYLTNILLGFETFNILEGVWKFSGDALFGQTAMKTADITLFYLDWIRTMFYSGYRDAYINFGYEPTQENAEKLNTYSRFMYRIFAASEMYASQLNHSYATSGVFNAEWMHNIPGGIDPALTAIAENQSKENMQRRSKYLENAGNAYATFCENSVYPIELHLMGGTYSIVKELGLGDNVVKWGKIKSIETTIPEGIPVRTGYEFLGWSTNPNATVADPEYASGNTYSKNDDLTLYAVWKQDASIHYNANGGTGEPASHENTVGSTTLSTTVPTRTGHTFLGWSESATATAATYQPSDVLTKDGNVTLYAVWKAGVFDIVFHANGGKFSDNSDSKTMQKTYLKNFTVSPEVPTRDGYTFSGEWTENADGSGHHIYQGTTLTDIDGKSGLHTRHFYAQWNSFTHPFRYDYNNCSDCDDLTLPLNNGVLSVKLVDPPQNILDKFAAAGKKFVKWMYIKPDGSTEYYKSGDTLTITNPGEPRECVYAIWEVASSGALLSVLTDKTSYQPGDTVTLTITADNSGYFTVDVSDNNGFKIKCADGSNASSGVFVENSSASTSNTLKCYDNGSSYTVKVYIPNNCSDGSYTVNIVASNGTYGVNGTETSKVAETITITVDTSEEEADSYSLLYHPNGGYGTVPDTERFKEGEKVEIMEPSGLKRDGYVFSHWTNDEDGDGKTYKVGRTYRFTDDVILYAQWKVDKTADVSKELELYLRTVNSNAKTGVNWYKPGDVIGLEVNIDNSDHFYVSVQEHSGWTLLHANGKTDIQSVFYEKNAPGYDGKQQTYTNGGSTIVSIQIPKNCRDGEYNIIVKGADKPVNSSGSSDGKILPVGITITVRANEQPDEVLLNKSEIILHKGNKTRLTATIVPEFVYPSYLSTKPKSIKWSSSDTSVATVDKTGEWVNVRSVGTGTATITATFNGVSASSKVTVVRCNHSIKEIDNDYLASPATCTSQATYYYVCECGDKGTSTYKHGDLAAHNYSAWSVIQQATETTAGIEQRTCSGCQNTEERSIPATGAHTTHTPGTTWHSDSEKHWHVCSVDGCTIKLNEGTHIFGELSVETPATETNTGVGYRTCTCGYSKSEVIPIIEHVHDWNTTYSKDATHHWYTCSKCTDIKEKSEHSWNSGVETIPATETSSGIMTYTCIVCSYAKNSIIPPLEHSHSWMTTWSKNTEKHWHACSGCTEVKDEANHTWDNGVITKPATESSTGIKTYTCTVCDYSKTETIPKVSTNGFQTNFNIGLLNGKWNTESDGSGTDYDTVLIEYQLKGDGIINSQAAWIAIDLTQLVWVDNSKDGVSVNDYIGAGKAIVPGESPVGFNIIDGGINRTSNFYMLKAPVVVNNGTVDEWSFRPFSLNYVAVSEDGKTLYLCPQPCQIYGATYEDFTTVVSFRFGVLPGTQLSSDAVRYISESERQLLCQSFIILMCDGVDMYCYGDAAGEDTLQAGTFTYISGGSGNLESNYSISGRVTGYDAASETIIHLLQDGEVRYSTTINAEEGSSVVTQEFAISGVELGTYDMVIAKARHLPYMITDITVDGDVDLTAHENEQISSIVLLAGDVNSDGCIDLQDVTVLTSSNTYGKTYDEAMTKSADINGDKCFDLQDLAIVTSEKNYGKAKVEIAY